MADPTQPPFDALSAPLGELIASVGRGVAEAQQAMDAATIDNLRAVYQATEGGLLDLQRIGWRPTWYHIPEAEAEISVALSVSSEQTATVTTTSGSTGRMKMYAAPVDASYTNRFGYALTAQSKLRFRVVPIPAATTAENLAVVPNLAGLTRAEAAALLDRMGITHTFTGGTRDDRKVLALSVAPGSVLLEGASLSVTVEADPTRTSTGVLSVTPIK